jgi:hypothetical protein
MFLLIVSPFATFLYLGMVLILNFFFITILDVFCFLNVLPNGLNFVFVATPVIHLISHRYWIKTALATAF